MSADKESLCVLTPVHRPTEYRPREDGFYWAKDSVEEWRLVFLEGEDVLTFGCDCYDKISAYTEYVKVDITDPTGVLRKH